MSFDYNRPQSIGRVKPYYGNFGINVRAYTYIRTMGPDGLKAVTERCCSKCELYDETT